MFNPNEIRAFYAMTPLWLWPVLWLQIRAMKRTFKRIEAAGYVGVAYHWDPARLRFVIDRLDKPDPVNPFDALTPSMEFIFAKAGYMPHNLWALTFNCIPLKTNHTRGLGPVRIPVQPILDPG